MIIWSVSMNALNLKSEAYSIIPEEKIITILHPFVFMIKPKNFPEVSPFNEVEKKKWQSLHKKIFRMVHERATYTYLIPFNIFVSPEFAQAQIYCLAQHCLL